MWTADLNVKYKTKELLEQKLGKHFINHGIGKDFFNRIQKAQIIKEKLDKLDYIKN